ncbi:MAG: DUF3108 domain-containing protein [Thermodesulfovibrionales bacterium]
MKKHLIQVGRSLLACGMLCLFFAGLPLRVSPAHSFSIPERLRYDLTWTGIKTGEAVLEARDHGQYVQFISTAESAKWVSFLYPVEDAVTSTVRRGEDSGGGFIGVPYRYRITLQEGKYRRDKEILFDYPAGKITHINHLKREVQAFPVKGMVFDPLSCFYYLRNLPLVVGKSVYIDLFDNKKTYALEVQVVRKETVRTPAGTFPAFVVKPLMKSEGIFHRKGDILIWLSDDERRVPVQVKTRVALGSVKAVLVGGTY